jgi:hypothetical protein
MKSTITFGKYKGYTPEQLKRIDTDYLAWGANNLKSSKWVDEFKQALSTVTIEDEAASMIRQDPDITFGEALNYLREMKELDAEQDEMIAKYESTKASIAQEWSAESGQPLAKIQAIIRRFEFGWDVVTVNNFSNTRQFDLFVKYMTKINQI